MKILLIWSGLHSPLYELRIRCIRRAKELYPNANFKVITTLKEFFQMEIIDYNNYFHELNEYNLNINDPLSVSDYMRFDYLSKHEDTLYLDTDVICMKSATLMDQCKAWRIGAIWSGKECDVIKDIFSKHENREVLFGFEKEFEKDKEFNNCFEHKPLWLKKDYKLF